MAVLLKNFIGLALVYLQKYWLLIETIECACAAFRSKVKGHLTGARDCVLTITKVHWTEGQQSFRNQFSTGFQNIMRFKCPYSKLKLSLQYFQGRSWQGFRKKGSSRYFQFKTFEDIGTFEELLYKVQQAMFFNWTSEQKQNYQIPRHRNIMSHHFLFFIGKRVRKVKHGKSYLRDFYF